MPKVTITEVIAALLALLPVYTHVIPYFFPSVHLPLGPPGVPFIGHAKILSTPERWKLFQRWGKKYGNIIYTHIFGRPMIILNKYDIATELMDQRGNIYSDRPRMVLIEEMMQLRSITFLPYGDIWKKHRRIIQGFFNPRAVVAFRPQQRHEVHVLIENIKKNPENILTYIKRFTASAIMTITYGHPVVSEDDQYLKSVVRANQLLIDPGAPGGTLVDLFPLLKWVPSFLPGGFFRRLANEARVALQVMMNEPFEMVKEQMANGTAQPSLTSQLLSEYEAVGVEDEAELQTIKEVAGSLYRAGADTTEAVITSFVLAMVLNPTIVKKAQAELDAVVGRHRLPEYEDRDRLPYIDCILKESLRWAPPFPLGIPHTVTETDSIDGYNIPKGSLIVPNVWLMMHDEENYVSPEEFRPERYLPREGDGTPVLDPASAVFGFGRRICPGRYFAEASIWLVIACLLSSFDILPPVDENGKEVKPQVIYSPGFIRKPSGFKCRVIPRS